MVGQLFVETGTIGGMGKCEDASGECDVGSGKWEVGRGKWEVGAAVGVVVDAVVVG